MDAGGPGDGGVRERSRIPPVRGGTDRAHDAQAAAGARQRSGHLRIGHERDPGGVRHVGVGQEHLNAVVGRGDQARRHAAHGRLGAGAGRRPGDDVQRGRDRDREHRARVPVLPGPELRPHAAAGDEVGAGRRRVDLGLHHPPGCPVAGRHAVHGRRRGRDVRPAHRSQFEVGRSLAVRRVLSAGNVERKDDQTVTFHLDRVYSDFPYLVSAFTYNSLITPKNYRSARSRRRDRNGRLHPEELPERAAGDLHEEPTTGRRACRTSTAW